MSSKKLKKNLLKIKKGCSKTNLKYRINIKIVSRKNKRSIQLKMNKSFFKKTTQVACYTILD